MEIEVPVKIRLLLRREAIAAMAREFAFTMGVTSAETLKIICDGVSEGLLETLELLLFDDDGQDQGYVFFEVDWEKHELVIESADERESFQVDLAKNVAEQIAPITAYVTAFLKAEAIARGVTDVHSIFSWASRADREKIDAFRKKHQLRKLESSTSTVLDGYRRRSEKYGGGSFPEMSSGGAFRPLPGA